MIVNVTPELRHRLIQGSELLAKYSGRTPIKDSEHYLPLVEEATSLVRNVRHALADMPVMADPKYQGARFNLGPTGQVAIALNELTEHLQEFDSKRTGNRLNSYGNNYTLELLPFVFTLHKAITGSVLEQAKARINDARISDTEKFLDLVDRIAGQ